MNFIIKLKELVKYIITLVCQTKIINFYYSFIPQIKPIIWLIIFLITIFTLIIFLINNYFIKSIIKNKKLNLNNNKFIKFKW